MPEPKRAEMLELEEDLPLQTWQWRASIALWLALLALMIAATAGLFGSGPMSRARAGAVHAPLWVEYQRIVRFGASVRLIVHARPQPDGIVRFTIERALLQAFRVESVIPAAASTAIVENGIEYRFAADQSESVPIVFDMQPASRWRVAGEIRSPDGAVLLTQFILP